MSAQPGPHQFGPSIAGVLSGEEAALASKLLAFRIDVVHEFVDQRDGNLLDLAFGVGHLADQDVAGGVDTALGVSIQHGESLRGELIQGNVVLDVFRNEMAVLLRHSAEVAGGK